MLVPASAHPVFGPSPWRALGGLCLLGLVGCMPMGFWGAREMHDRDGAGAGVVVGDEGEGEGDVAGEGEGEGDVAGEGEGEGDVVGEGEGEGDVVGEGEGEGEGDGAGNVWLQIDYSSAFTPTSPAFTFSQTPGFTGSSWAADGASYPEAWDRFNNMQVVDDPIGTSLELDGELQLMVGLSSLQSYDRAVVRLEGRAREVSSPVTFDVYNPLNGCGVTGVTMSNDWTVHVVDVDLADCLVPGGGVQAVRVAPTNGTLALVRMKLILENAAY